MKPEDLMASDWHCTGRTFDWMVKGIGLPYKIQ